MNESTRALLRQFAHRHYNLIDVVSIAACACAVNAGGWGFLVGPLILGAGVVVSVTAELAVEPRR